VIFAGPNRSTVSVVPGIVDVPGVAGAAGAAGGLAWPNAFAARHSMKTRDAAVNDLPRFKGPLLFIEKIVLSFEF
jgi:hypothetical protein